MKELSKKHNTLIISEQYGEYNETQLPHQKRGFTIENKSHMDLCPFYEYCVVYKGIIGQVTCLKCNEMTCKKRAMVRNLEDDL